MLILQPGGILGPSGKPMTLWQRLFGFGGRKSWYSGATQDEADASMRKIVDLVREEAMPFFTHTRSVAGLLKYLKADRWGSDHHLSFEIGCCLARLKQFDQAVVELEHAATLYEEDGLEWCAKESDRVRTLLTAIKNGTAEVLLQQWEQESIKALKLGPLFEKIAKQRHSADTVKLRG
jgi:hypothetical protein